MTSLRTRQKLVSVMLLSSIFGMTGCGNRAIFIQPGTVAVTTAWIKNAKVAVPDKDGNLVPSSADLPPGTMVKVSQEKEGKEKR